MTIKTVAGAALLLLFCVVCCTQSVTPDDLKKAANQRVQDCLDRVGASQYRHEVEIIPFVENKATRDGNYFVGIRFDVDMGRSDDFQYTFGAVGIGSSEVEAVETALDEWAVQFVPTFCDSLRRAETGLPFGEFLVYRSVTTIRGDPPRSRRNDLDSDILKSLSPILDYVTLTGTMPISLLLEVQPDGSINGQCRTWGELAPQVVELLRGVEWPVGATSYMIKKYFIVVAK